MKKCWILLLLLLLPLIVASGENCEHEWTAFNPYKHGYLAEEVKIIATDEESHQCIMTVPESMCARCDAREYKGSVIDIANRHAYFVSDWCYQDEGAAIEITWTCSLCEYERIETIPLQTIINGSGETCLHGGVCDAKNVGYMHEDGYIYDSGAAVLPDLTKPDDTKRLFYDALLAQNGETGIELSLVCREYCSLCGRPSVTLLSRSLQSFSDQWNGLSVYTEEAYLQRDMPQNLPYQLIDQLRREAAGK